MKKMTDNVVSLDTTVDSVTNIHVTGLHLPLPGFRHDQSVSTFVRDGRKFIIAPLFCFASFLCDCMLFIFILLVSNNRTSRLNRILLVLFVKPSVSLVEALPFRLKGD